MVLMIVCLISYISFVALILTALLLFKRDTGRRIKFRDILILIFWPLAIFRGLFGILDDNFVSGVEIVAVVNTVVFWVTFISWLAI